MTYKTHELSREPPPKPDFAKILFRYFESDPKLLVAKEGERKNAERILFSGGDFSKQRTAIVNQKLRVRTAKVSGLLHNV